MRKHSFTGAVLVVAAAAGLVASCDDPASSSPTRPTVPTASNIEISGPDSVAPGQSAQFYALVQLADGTRKSATSLPNLRWRTANSSMLQVSPAGVVTAGQQPGETTLTAEMTGTGGVKRGTRDVVVVPDGTYRLVGVVTDAESSALPVVGARVEVTPGPLVATTDFSGVFKVYGVPAHAEVVVVADGYHPQTQSLELTSHATRNFQLTLAGPRPEFTGSFTLVIEVVDGCSGSRPLAPDLRRRSYDAVLRQSGTTVDVALTEPRFATNSISRGNRFTGRVLGGGITFTLEPYWWYYYPYYGPTSYPNVAERLPDGTYLTVEGTAATSGSAAGLSGPLRGFIANWDSRFPFSAFILGSCSGSLQLTLTPR